MSPIRFFAFLSAFLLLLASGPAPAVAQIGDRLVPVNGMLLPLHGAGDEIAGTLIVDLRIEARDDTTAGRIRMLEPRIRDLLLSRLVLRPSQGVHVSAENLEGIRRRILQLVRDVVGEQAVANIYFARVHALPT